MPTPLYRRTWTGRDWRASVCITWTDLFSAAVVMAIVGFLMIM